MKPENSDTSALPLSLIIPIGAKAVGAIETHVGHIIVTLIF